MNQYTANRTFVLASALLAILAGKAFAQTTASNCALLGDPAERLECFDRQFGKPEGAEQETAPGRKQTPARNSKPKPEKIEITSSIKALHKQDKQKMIFMLENGETWIQSSPRPVPVRAGDKVTIKSGIVRGFILRTENGVSTRVVPVK